MDSSSHPHAAVTLLNPVRFWVRTSPLTGRQGQWGVEGEGELAGSGVGHPPSSPQPSCSGRGQGARIIEQVPRKGTDIMLAWPEVQPGRPSQAVKVRKQWEGKRGETKSPSPQRSPLLSSRGPGELGCTLPSCQDPGSFMANPYFHWDQNEGRGVTCTFHQTSFHPIPGDPRGRAQTLQAQNLLPCGHLGSTRCSHLRKETDLASAGP